METKAGVVPFAFGAPNHLRSNIRIAKDASIKAWDKKAPVFTQRDIVVWSVLDVTYIEEVIGNPPSTLRIARGAVKWAIERGITELWIASAEPHRPRCIRDVEFAIREAGADITLMVCEGIDGYPYELWFCGESAQERTRTQEVWESREYILMNLPFFVYKLVAR